MGYKFHRQFRIGPFITDFCCFEKRLIIELDGSQHVDAKDKDENRTFFLESQGYRMMRFWNNDALKNTELVCEMILTELAKDTVPSPHPSPKGEGGRRPGEGPK
jgi:very-short-patch-repair endonuclease